MENRLSQAAITQTKNCLSQAAITQTNSMKTEMPAKRDHSHIYIVIIEWKIIKIILAQWGGY